MTMHFLKHSPSCYEYDVRAKNHSRHLGFNLLIEQPFLRITKNKAQIKEMKFVVVATGLTRDECHEYHRRQHPGSKFRIQGARLDFTSILVRNEREKKTG